MFRKTLRPSACGLVVFDGGIGMIDAPGTSIPVDACTWGPHPAGGLGVTLWLRRSRLGEVSPVFQRAFASVADEVPPLIPAVMCRLPIGDPEPWETVETSEALTSLRTLAATWLLMQQPVLVDHVIERPDRSVRRRYAREQRPDPQITVVDLRRRYVPDQRGDDSSVSRQYRYRWIVSGHWRNQAYGKDRAERRQQWIPAHEKGPDGAPLLVTEKVNVWRR